MPLIGIDFGARRIGLAISESGALARPHSVLRRGEDTGPAIEAIARLAAEIGADTLVVGIPVGGRVAASSNQRLYAEFASRLREETSLTVVLWDEGYSTTEAASMMRDSGTNRRDAKARIDMVAAAVILQSYLDAMHRERP